MESYGLIFEAPVWGMMFPRTGASFVCGRSFEECGGTIRVLSDFFRIVPLWVCYYERNAGVASKEEGVAYGGRAFDRAAVGRASFD